MALASRSSSATAGPQSGANACTQPRRCRPPSAPRPGPAWAGVLASPAYQARSASPAAAPQASMATVLRPGSWISQKPSPPMAFTAGRPQRWRQRLRPWLDGIAAIAQHIAAGLAQVVGCDRGTPAAGRFQGVQHGVFRGRVPGSGHLSKGLGSLRRRGLGRADAGRPGSGPGRPRAWAGLPAHSRVGCGRSANENGNRRAGLRRSASSARQADPERRGKARIRPWV